METNRIKPGQKVDVQITAESGDQLFTFTCNNVHNVTEAINEAYDASGIQESKLDFTYTVTNLDTNISERYRINAGGNVKLLE